MHGQTQRGSPSSTSIFGTMKQDLTELMDAYWDGTLDAKARTEFESKLASDAELRKELNLHKQVILAIEGQSMEDTLVEEEKKYAKNHKRYPVLNSLSYVGAVLAMAACIAAYIVLTPLVDQMTVWGNSQFTEYYNNEASLIVRGADDNLDLLADAMTAIEAENWRDANKSLNAIIKNAEGSDDAQLLQVKDDAEWLKAIVSMKRGRYFSAKRQLKAIANSQSAYASDAQTILDSLK